MDASIFCDKFVLFLFAKFGPILEILYKLIFLTLVAEEEKN